VTTNQLGRVADGQRFIHLTIKESGVTWFGTGGDHQADPYPDGPIFEFVSADPNVDSWDPETEEGQAAPSETPHQLNPDHAHDHRRNRELRIGQRIRNERGLYRHHRRRAEPR
jgi:hypothetical protein